MSQQKGYIKPVSIDGTYVKAQDGRHLLTPKAMLKADDIGKSSVRVKTSSDRDISASLDGRTGYVKEVYLKFENGEISTSIAIADCILEYRSTAGAGKTFARGGRKWEGTYLKTYACVGLPKAVVDAMIQKMSTEDPGLDWDHGASICSEKEGSYWPTVKLSQDSAKDGGFTCLAVDRDQLINFDPVALMSRNHKSLMGIGMFSFRLKKVGENPKACRNKKYTLGISMTSFQVTRETTQKGPGITENMPTVGFKDYSATTELVDSINEMMRDAEVDDEESESEESDGVETTA